MKTALIYISKHGTTEKVAGKISANLAINNDDIFNLRENRNPEVQDYERIIIGGSIHAGMIQKRVKDFCTKNIDLLLKKEVALFICAMEKEKAEEEFNSAFPQKLRDHSKAKLIAGGEFIFEKMNFLEKAIVKKIAKTDKTISDINYEAIERFTNEMKEAPDLA